MAIIKLENLALFELSLKLKLSSGKKNILNFLDDAGNILVHVDFRTKEQSVVINSMIGKVWGNEVKQYFFPFVPNQEEELSFLFDGSCLNIRRFEDLYTQYFFPSGTGRIESLSTNIVIQSFSIKAPEYSTYSIRNRRKTPDSHAPDQPPYLSIIRINNYGDTPETSLKNIGDELIEVVAAPVLPGEKKTRLERIHDFSDRIKAAVESATHGNVLVVSGQSIDKNLVSKLVAECGLRFRDDAFAFATDSPSTKPGEDWMLAFSKKMGGHLSSYFDTIFIDPSYSHKALWLKHWEIATPPYLPDWYQALPHREGETVSSGLRLARVPLIVALPDLGNDNQSAQNWLNEFQSAGVHCYRVTFGKAPAMVVAGDELLVPEPTLNEPLQSLIQKMTYYLFGLTYADQIIFVTGGNRLPLSIVESHDLWRCLAATLSDETGKAIVWITSREFHENRKIGELTQRQPGALSLAAKDAYIHIYDLWGGNIALAKGAALRLKKYINLDTGLPENRSIEDAHAPVDQIPDKVSLNISTEWLQLFEEVSFKNKERHEILNEVSKHLRYVNAWEWKLWLAFHIWRLGDAGIARKMIQDVMSIDFAPEDVVHNMLAVHHESMANWAEAERLYQFLIGNFGKWPQPVCGMARAKSMQGHSKEALALLDAELSSTSERNWTDPLTEEKLKIHERLGDWQNVIKHAPGLIAKGYKNAELSLKLANACMHAGDAALARSTMDHFKESELERLQGLELERNKGHDLQWIKELALNRLKENDTLLYLEARYAHLLDDEPGCDEEIVKCINARKDYRPLLGQKTFFNRLDKRPLSIREDEIVCIIVGRNESLRLPWLMSYYKKLGVDRFLVIDNGSTDGAVEYLLENTDAHVFQTLENYSSSRYGVKWHNELADEYANNRWLLVVDADEALVYPEMENVGLRQLCTYMDEAGFEGLRTFMLDMYSDKPMRDVAYQAGQSLIEACPWFDTGPYSFWPNLKAPYFSVTGGVRQRVFWSRRHGQDVAPPAIQKIPLVKWRRGMKFLSSTHEVSPLKIADISGVLLHFKFLQDFHKRAMEEVQRKEHYNGASEYALYLDILEENPDISFHNQDSVKFAGSEELVSRKLMTSTNAFRDFSLKTKKS